MQTSIFLTIFALVFSGDDINGMDQTKPAVTRNEALRKELLERVKVDQGIRLKLIENAKRGPTKDPAESKKTTEAILAGQEIDKKNTAWLKEIVRKQGWPGKSLVGVDGANAAFLLVQHADLDKEFQKECLKLMKAAFARKEATGTELAYLTDRVLVGDKKKQLYGSQFTLRDGKYVAQPIEDEANVDKRRKELGLQSLADYGKLLNEMYLPKAKEKQ